jgi:hypothetical protein
VRRATTLRALRALLRASPALAALPPHPWRTLARSRADAATSAVLAALPGGAKRALRQCCRAGRDGVDAHARRLEVGRGPRLISAAAAARMTQLREVDVTAGDDDVALRLAAGLRALAQGPAVLTCATVLVTCKGPALGALARLTALTRLDLDVRSLSPGEPWTAPPLVLPWANIEVGAVRNPRGGVASRGGLPAGASGA